MPWIVGGKMRGRVVTAALVALSVLAVPADLPATDAPQWPQWRGPDRDMRSKETGLLKRWPEGGPKLLWSLDGLGIGFGTVSIAEGTLYVVGTTGGDETLFACDLNGTLKWKRDYGPYWKEPHPGARTTPTVDGGNVYVISGTARAACFEAATGAPVWSVDGKTEFGTAAPSWGTAESPLIVGDRMIFSAGAPSASVVALDKHSGTVVWKTKELSEKSAYCSPLAVKRGTRDLIITVLARHVVGIDADTGRLLWKLPYRNKCSAHPNTPVHQDGFVYITSGYDAGGLLLRLSANGDGADVVWRDKTMDTHHGNVVLVDGYLYGSSWIGNSKGQWVCLEFTTGQVKYDHPWRTGGVPSKGSLTYADGMLYGYAETKGVVALVPATPAAFKPVSSFRVPKGSGPHWGHPVVCGGRLYIRHGDVLMAYALTRAGSLTADAH
ncbi:MAG: PQQ-like beta-propeller repeat protein [Kiritimatiellae bacterium]|nr:PQQ-like beta-propeller repeat protein [Kiritimatiellia bacterium]